jgi:hypothetical protein
VADFNKATKLSSSAARSFLIAKTRLNQTAFLIFNLFDFLGYPQVAERMEKALDLGGKAASGLSHLGSAANQSRQLAKFVLTPPTKTDSENQPDPRQTITQINLELDKAYEELSLVEGRLESQSTYRQTIVEIRNLLLRAKIGIKLIPELIGLNKRQVYLVLFQNNAEIRPTGGFIGSYGLLTFEGGQLIDFEVSDVYVADGQLKGHVEPPADLKKYLGEAGWYLRDSNWDPDFPTSAARAAWFLEKTTGRAVDGVVGINLNLAKKLIEALGEVGLPDYQGRITAQNLFERAEYHSGVNFFPGSTEKQDFLGSLARAMFEEIKNASEKTWLGLAKGIHQSLRSKDLLVWLNDPQGMEAVNKLGWDGTLRQTQCKEKKIGCFKDYLMVVESNVGINKANYFVKRSLSYQVKISNEGIPEGTIQINYRNESQSEVFPAGRYKSYLRVYVPPKSELVGIRIKNPTTDEIKEVGEKEIKEEHEKQVFGFLLEVPIREARSVEVVWRLAEKLTTETTQYLLLLQKQSGIEDESFSFWFTPPADTKAFSGTPGSTQTTQGLVFTPKFDQDLIFEINLLR